MTLVATDKLHIAMVVRSFSENGGLELYAHRVIEGLLSQGHSITVICEEADSAFIHPLLTVKHFTPSRRKARKSERITHYFHAATQRVKELGPFDIVHSQHLPMEGADVVSFHNHTAERLSKVGQPWEKLLCHWKMSFSNAYSTRYKQDEILCQAPVLMFSSAVCRDDFRQTYKLDDFKSQASYVVAYPGADFPRAQNEINRTNNPVITKSANEPFTFLFVGKGFRKKGLDILLKACSLLKQRQKPFRLLIAGLKEKPIDTLRKKLLGLQDEVIYLGFRADMENVYAQAQATILPSRIEPFGMSSIQGMLHGLVPIVSRVSGVSEVLTNGIDSLILKNHLSSQELSELMQKLIDNPELCITLSSAAKKLASNLTWDKSVDATLTAYSICENQLRHKFAKKWE